jgi:hypothetical protein
MECYERLVLGIALRRKYKGSSKVEKIKWNKAIERARAGITWNKGILELPVFKDISAEADRLNAPYANFYDVYFRLIRDYGSHCLEHRWVSLPPLCLSLLYLRVNSKFSLLFDIFYTTIPS